MKGQGNLNTHISSYYTIIFFALESQKQRTHNTSNIDPDFISDMEKKWKGEWNEQLC